MAPEQPYPMSPPGQPGGYYQGPPGHANAQQQQTNGKAVASMVLGILSYILLPVIGPILAVILGHSARKEIKANPNQTGDGMAVAGLVLGWISIGLMILALLIVFVVLVIVGSIVGA